jgi:hypothetical protein
VSNGPRVYRCACCGRKLKPERWIYSRFTKSRYCWPTEGCWKKRTRKGAGQAPSLGSVNPPRPRGEPQGSKEAH